MQAFRCNFMVFFSEFWKICKGSLLGLKQIHATEIPLKLIKNTFIAREKLFSFLRNLIFCPDFLVIQESSLLRKISSI